MEINLPKNTYMYLHICLYITYYRSGIERVDLRFIEFEFELTGFLLNNEYYFVILWHI